MRHWREFILPLQGRRDRIQAARCMNCGMPYCQGTGSPAAPVPGQQPDPGLERPRLQRQLGRGRAQSALDQQFPGVTGRVCPAPCEASCTLNIDDNPVTIKTIECAIADRAIAEGWIKPEPPAQKTGKRVAVVGSGPAGLACAQQLARAGHEVHVYEKNAKAGGLLRYGIPDFKMEKHHVDRRVAQMEAEGVSLPLQRPCRRQSRCREAPRRATTPWCSPAAPRRRATCRSPGASSRASISPWTSCRSRTGASAGEPAAAGEPDPRRRQARRRHRRRRHRLRLHRHLVPPGRAVGDQVRDHAAAAASTRTSC